MKRLIKYWNKYSKDKATFSTCGTEYEILDLVADDFGFKELKTLAEVHGLKTAGSCFNPCRDKRYGNFKISESIKLVEKHTRRTGYNGENAETLQVFLGFVELPEDRYCPLPPLETSGNDLPEMIGEDDTVYSICNTQSFGMYNVTEINGELHIVMQGWEFFHSLPLLGYSLESLYKLAGTSETTFQDEVFSCGECGESDWNDNGYQYNYRIIECEIFGLNCGCYEDYCKSSGGLENFQDNADSAMESDAIEYHIEQGNITFLERFVGGMTDSNRSHSYDGESVEVSSPEEALEKFKEKFPESSFVFCHDESGQFQTYFSIYKVEGI